MLLFSYYDEHNACIVIIDMKQVIQMCVHI
jgi:hypothetical protein